jgi:hypothetical protein
MIDTKEIDRRLNLWNEGYWEVPDNLDTTEFNFDWRPDPCDRPYIHQFGTQHQPTGGPRFIIPEHEGIKYQEFQHAIRKPDINNRAWRPLLTNSTIDFSWHPPDTDPPYIYIFGNQWYDVDIMPTYQYRVSGATEKKFMYDVTATLLPDQSKWEIPDNIIEFDYSWVPHPYEPTFIWQFGTQWQKNGGPKYIVDGAETVKHIDVQHAIIDNSTNKHWRPLQANINFDYSWHPDEDDPPYIYVFGNQWYEPEIMPTVLYRVKGATEKKFIHDHKATLLADKAKWKIPDNIDDSMFDYSWVPNPTDPPLTYKFGTQWQRTGGPVYDSEVSTGIKYMSTMAVKRLPDTDNRNWRPLHANIDFDYSWHPDEDDSPYIYIFGNQWYDSITMPTIIYRISNSTEKKYIDNHKATLLADKSKWTIPDDIDDSMFDYSWVPNPNDPPLEYRFGTQWQKTGGPSYLVQGATKVKYVDTQKVTKLVNMRNWRMLDEIETDKFDFSWHPDDTEPLMIYEFGTQWQTGGGPIYVTKGSTKKKYCADQIAIRLSLNKSKWIVPDDIDDSMFDYTWHPNPNDPPFIYQFGTQWQKTGGPRYVVFGATEVKYVTTQKVIKLANMRNWRMLAEIETDKFDFSWHPDDTEPAMMYEFGTQWQTGGGPIYVTKGSTNKKYCSDQVAIRKATEDRQFRPLVNNLEFDYSWHPHPDDPPFIYVFGNQWHKAEVMPTLLYRVKSATEKKYVTDVIAKLTPNLDNWIIPDDVDDSMFDYSWCPDPGEPPFIYKFGTQWQKTGGPNYIVPGADKIKYIDVLKAVKKPNNRNWRIIEPINTGTFDFSWHPDDTEENYTYVFGNKFHTPEIMPTLTYKSTSSIANKFITDISADLSIEQVEYEDSIFDALHDGKYSTAYIHFVKKKHPTDYSFLSRKELTVHLMGDDAIVPRNTKTYMYNKLTDYEHCVTHSVSSGEPLDIIFFSNGEACADSNYEHLLSITKDLPNKVIRIDKINGRIASQYAAANASATPWYFLVNAKLRVSENFDFIWQPNVYKSRRHYIFTATNPVNNLEYGHQAIVANNKKLTLSTVGRGLDFTMDSRTEVIEVNSGVALYNSSEWDTWRTSFRECIKLSYAKDKTSKDRLNTWLTVGSGEFAEHSIQGAKDAVEYYNSVNGELEKLKLTYDWDWIKQYHMELSGRKIK